jgi:hypothetical protein
MLTCLPQSICSWDYRIPDASAGPAAVTFNFFTEQGAISLGGAEYAIRKHGPLSGHWTLEAQGRPVGDAQKPNPFTRRFELDVDGCVLTLRASSSFTRRFDFVSGGKTVGTICPAHPFTRRATIECASDVSELAQLFSFWLVAMTWRREGTE